MIKFNVQNIVENVFINNENNFFFNFHYHFKIHYRIYQIKRKYQRLINVKQFSIFYYHYQI